MSTSELSSIDSLPLSRKRSLHNQSGDEPTKKFKPLLLLPSSEFSYSEIVDDLFSCPSDASMAHCISADCALGKGIALLFKKKFDGIADLKAQKQRAGGCAVLH